MTGKYMDGKKAKAAKRMLISLAAAVALSGCAGVATDKMDQVKVGMTWDEVIAVMGKPDNVAAISGNVKADRIPPQANGEYYKYMLAENKNDPWNWLDRKPYFVSFSQGKVDAFGKIAAFDSDKNPSKMIKTENPIVSNENSKSTNSGECDIPGKLRELKKLESEKVITHDDFEMQKKKLLDDYTKSHSPAAD
jgi:hypothetical protein